MSKVNALEIKNSIFWTGVLDYDIRVFDVVMYTKYGTTYNSYIVKGENKTALIEVAKESFFDEFSERVGEICDLSKIDYVILDHTEPDHSGSLAKLLEINPNIEVIGTQTAIKFAKEITNLEFNHRVVCEGDIIDLGGKTLRFISAPFLHWPDSMFTYCEEEKILFSCDAFGCHFCSDKVFNDLVELEGFYDAYKYYFDVIMGPFKGFVLQALDKVEKLDLEYVCPGHGPVLRTDLQKYFDMYREWSTVKKSEKPSIVMPYVSSYGYTRKLAEKVAEGIKSVNTVEVHVFDLVEHKVSEAIEKVAEAGGIIVGSPTLIGDTLPPIWEFLTQLNPIINKGMIAGAFGSYGWSGEAVKNIEDRFKQLRFKMPIPSLRVVFNPSDDDLAKAFEFGKTFAEEVDKCYKMKYTK